MTISLSRSDIVISNKIKSFSDTRTYKPGNYGWEMRLERYRIESGMTDGIGLTVALASLRQEGTVFRFTPISPPPHSKSPILPLQVSNFVIPGPKLCHSGLDPESHGIKHSDGSE